MSPLSVSFDVGHLVVYSIVITVILASIAGFSWLVWRIASELAEFFCPFKDQIPVRPTEFDYRVQQVAWEREVLRVKRQREQDEIAEIIDAMPDYHGYCGMTAAEEESNV